MRLIDADAAITEWRRINNIDENDRGARFVGYTEIPRLLNHMPTINAEPAKHGEWVKLEIKGIINPFTGENRTYIGCSCCGEPIPTDSILDIIEPEEANFCLGCGADMRKKGGDNHETD